MDELHSKRLAKCKAKRDAMYRAMVLSQPGGTWFEDHRAAWLKRRGLPEDWFYAHRYKPFRPAVFDF